MFDDNTLIVSYDTARGNHAVRAAAASTRPARGSVMHQLHDVRTGLPDRHRYRDGLQYECISCSACIDVCDDVMAKMNYAPGLIRYTTQNALDGKPSRIVRPRTLVYSALLAAVAGLFLYLLFTREPLALDIIRDRNQLYRERAGLIENVYTLKVLNLAERPRRFVLSATGIPGLQLAGPEGAIEVAAGAVQEVAVVLRADEGELAERSTRVSFTLEATDDPAVRVSEISRFLGPGR